MITIRFTFIEHNVLYKQGLCQQLMIQCIPDNNSLHLNLQYWSNLDPTPKIGPIL